MDTNIFADGALISKFTIYDWRLKRAFKFPSLLPVERFAEGHSAIQQTGSLRYERLRNVI